MDNLQTSERGYTMIELMIGMLITLIIAAAAFTSLTGTQKASAVNDQTTQLQQNARLAIDLLSNDIKMAGFGMTAAVGNCATALVPLDNNTGGTDTGPDQVRLVVPTILSTLKTQATGPFTTLTLQSGAVAAVTPSGFGSNSPISVGGIMAMTVSSVSGDVLTVPSVPAPAVFGVGTQVFWLQCITYAIGTTTTICGGPTPCLLRGVRNLAVPNVNNDSKMVPVVEGIEDIQLTYACDGCNGSAPDGIVDDQNASGTFDAGDFISNNTWTSGTMTPDTIRLIQVSIVARQSRADQGLTESNSPAVSTSAPIVIGDHNPSGDPGFTFATYSTLRRRVLTRTVEVRNVGLVS